MTMIEISLTEQERDMLRIAMHELTINPRTTGLLRSLGITTVQEFDHTIFAIQEKLAGPQADGEGATRCR
jgi:hypothetical protein